MREFDKDIADLLLHMVSLPSESHRRSLPVQLTEKLPSSKKLYKAGSFPMISQHSNTCFHQISILN
jgi:hypothetical protein